MKCREELGQIVMTIFFDVDPTHVKKQTGDFGKVFKRTCKGKTKEEIKRWRKVLEDVATIAGEHSRNWDNEAAMIEKIAIDVSNMLNSSIPSKDFDGLIGMGAHMKEMESLLCLDSDEVRMIGIWGPSGIGKTTIARVLYSQFSENFELCVFMDNIKELMYARPVCSDDYGTKLHLQKQFMSLIMNHKDIEIPHLGIAQNRLYEKKVLIFLDSIDQSLQLDAIAKETRWFGHGSRIIITTQDQKLLKAHGINHIYKVEFPSTYEACQIFCTYAFGQNFPKDGFEELAWQVIKLLGNLPLGLRVMGSHCRGLSKQEWINALPRLRTHLDANIQSILKFSYDALCEEDKDLFLHIACIFNHHYIKKVEAFLAHKFLDVRQGLHLLEEKSLISLKYHKFIEDIKIEMHDLLVQLGREIVRHKHGNQSICKPGKRQFLVDARDILEVLTDETGTGSVMGISSKSNEISSKLNISEIAFEGMSNLEFLIFKGPYDDQSDKLYLPQGLTCLPRKLRILEWDRFLMTCLPSNFCTEYLVKLDMRDNKLQKLWDGNLPLGNLKWMDLTGSKHLKELPDLSTATNLQELSLTKCSSLVELPSTIGNNTNLQNLDLSMCKSLVELPSSIGNATNLQSLDLSKCTSLVELPFSIGNATYLKILNLSKCTSLVELPSSIGKAINLQILCLDKCSLVELPSSIGSLHKLRVLSLEGCSKLESLPPNINLESLDRLDLTDCLLIKKFPEISTNIEVLKVMRTAIKEVPYAIKSWPRLGYFEMSYNENLKEFPHALDTITMLYFNDIEMQEISPCVMKFSRLQTLVLEGCKKLVTLPQFPDSLSIVGAINCESLERLDFSFHNHPDLSLWIVNCFRLNKEAREVIQTSGTFVISPGREVPANFTYRTNSGSSVMVNLNNMHLSTTLRFKACILLVNKDDKEKEANGRDFKVSCLIVDKLGVYSLCRPKTFRSPAIVAEHLLTFALEADVTSNDLSFVFMVDGNEVLIKACGVLQL